MNNKNNYERTFLAIECANALNLKPISPILYEYGVKYKDIPVHICDETFIKRNEQSLLSMGVVYSYDQKLSFIDINGSTYYLPYCNAVIEELKRCGYVICEYEKHKPNFDSRESVCEEEIRDRITLPKELSDKVMKFENILFDKYVYNNKIYNYDVFDNRLFRFYPDSFSNIIAIIKHLGYDNINARKYMALNSYGCRGLSTVGYFAENLKEFAILNSNHSILNDKIYYGNNGLYLKLINKKRCLKDNTK